jgi:pimeloyl-ACP methyl ester carboxylesterase
MSMYPQDGSRPTVVLVHGAFAESASWNDVIGRLQDQGYTAIAAANPLRSVASDAEFVISIFETVEGPIVLVGHSYGGIVITNAVRDKENVKALVYVAGFAPEERENAFELSGVSPGARLAISCGPSRSPTAAPISTSARKSTTSSSRKTSQPSRPPSWPWANGLCGTSRSTRPRGPRRGSRSRRGSCLGSSTRISPWRRTASWPSAPEPARS